VAKAFRSDPALSGAVLVALTGWGASGDRERAAQAGFDHHLTKPADPARIEAVLAGAAEKLR
jgi:CheY-like chemotaxis protein